MYWLYFARDFYKTPARSSAVSPAAKPAPVPASRVITRSATAALAFANAEVAMLAPPPPPAPRKKRPAPAAKRTSEYVVKSKPLEKPAKPAKQKAAKEITKEVAKEDRPSPVNAYLQRLSVDGEHAFGVWDEDAGFSLFSANFDRVTGLSSGDCAGHDWIHLIHHDQQYAVNEALLNAIEGHDGQCLVQAQHYKEGAESRWLLMDVKASHGKQSNIMVLFRDLTEKMALEEALKKTESALAVAERSRAAFLSSMSHELRTPLNAIMGFSEMMRSSVFGELGNPTYKEYAKHIHESGNALLGKINDLLDIASMDAGGLTIEEEEFHLGHMLGEAVQMHSHHAFERQQHLHLDCPYELEMNGDRAKLMCAMSHLISNAIRHSEKGAEIQVFVRVQDEDVIISVHDTGEGIAQPQLDIIRDALNADVTYFNISSGGIGLGLSLTKELASRHGGKVMIDSVRHRGTVVALILPTHRAIDGLPEPRRRSS